MKRIRFLAIAVLFLANAVAASALPLQNGSRPQPLALEVTFFRGQPPAYQRVPPLDSKPRGAWYAKFGRVDASEAGNDPSKVKAINIVAKPERDGVRFTVSVYLGENFFDEEKIVESYFARQNDTVVADGLTRFGVEPFTIKVVSVPLSNSPLPTVSNKTTSIAVLNTEVNNANLPSYRLSIRNLAQQSVNAIGLNVFVNGKRRLSTIQQGDEGDALVAAGELYNFNIPAAVNSVNTGGGIKPASPLDQEIVITAVVFKDGSFEGDPETAGTFRGFEAGRKAQLAKLLDILNSVPQSGSSPEEMLGLLKVRVSEVSDVAPSSVLDQLREDFNMLGPEDRQALKVSVEVSMHQLKFKTLREIEALEKQGITAETSLQSWLRESIERYESWLSKL